LTSSQLAGYNVGWSVILASYHHYYKMFSTAARFVRAHGVLHSVGLNTVIFPVSKA